MSKSAHACAFSFSSSSPRERKLGTHAVQLKISAKKFQAKPKTASFGGVFLIQLAKMDKEEPSVSK